MAQLYFYYSSMNAGKSTSLLQSAYNYRERGLNVLLFTAALDDRHSVGRIASRIGLSEEAELFDGQSNLLVKVQHQHEQTPISCVLVDEAQFLTEAQVWQLSDVVDHLNIPVLCYGLRTDFRGELFSGSQVLLAIAEKITELKTICHCGRKATMVVRIGESGEVFKQGAQVEIGGNDRYVSLCRKHQKQAMQSGRLVSDQML